MKGRGSAIMTSFQILLEKKDLAATLLEGEAQRCAAELSELSHSRVYPRSLAQVESCLFFLTRATTEKRLGIVTASADIAARFTGERREIAWGDQKFTLLMCPTSPGNAIALRAILPFLTPRLLGLRQSAGCGDRLGLATPGHIRAIRQSGLAPIFAQQSIRENARTGRTPQVVMDDAMWAVFQEGWREGFGADADHLKTTDDIDSCVAAGYTFYTIDPGEHVDNEASVANVDSLQEKVAALPWPELDTNWKDLKLRLAGAPVRVADFSISISEEELLRAAAKYARVVAHTVKMFRHLEQAMNGRPFELEMSVDETETVTTAAEHIYIADELRRLRVRWVSLAPRYAGTFEKGVDFIGDIGDFERSFVAHAAIARSFGPYKLSLHSGSDKFSIYPVAARLAGELIHLKTAGTSYLEALRTIAQTKPALFRELVAFAVTCYPQDRASYHVSAKVETMPDVDKLADDQLTNLLDDFHAREILHVTFGSVLQHPDLREAFFATLRNEEETYYQMLETHFGRHFAPFAEGRPTNFSLSLTG
jgi:hypothetical protein